jgi:hypothetical protein
VFVGVLVGVCVTVGVTVGVRVLVGVEVTVGVNVLVGVTVAVGDTVTTGVTVAVALGSAVALAEAVCVLVGVGVGAVAEHLTLTNVGVCLATERKHPFARSAALSPRPKVSVALRVRVVEGLEHLTPTRRTSSEVTRRVHCRAVMVMALPLDKVREKVRGAASDNDAEVRKHTAAITP